MPLGEIKNIANVLYILELKKNLLNMSKIISQNYIVVFDSKQCLVIHKQDHWLTIKKTWNPFNGLYHHDVKLLIKSPQVHVVDQVHAIDHSFARLWHHMLGHLNYQGLSFLFKSKMAIGIPNHLQLRMYVMGVKLGGN
jgi:hypothetical protein